jgi:hypothetical protein
MYAMASPSVVETILFTRKHAILTHLPHTARQNKDISIQLRIFMFQCNLKMHYVLTLYQRLYLPLFNNEIELTFHSKHTFYEINTDSSQLTTVTSNRTSERELPRACSV